MARGLLIFFVVVIGGVMVVEIAGAARQAGGAERTAWSGLLNLPSAMRSAVEGDMRIRAGMWHRIVAGNRAALAGMSAFEDALEDESLLGRSLRPRAQVVLTGWLGSGNERVYIGRDRWLFYSLDVEYLTAPPFLDPLQMRRRRNSAEEWSRQPHPDPRPAILHFHRLLQNLGIQLVVMPTPVKPAIHPEQLGRSGIRAAVPLHNASFSTLLTDLERAGVVVFDPAPVLAAARSSGALYLARDTHWRPEAVELVADRLAAYIRTTLDLSPPSEPLYGTDDREVVNRGDTAAMLDLPEGETLYPPERVWIRRVTSKNGTPWRPSQTADVIVLGDSFTNIYSLASMGWGDSAGLVEQLSHALNRPIDRIVQNDAGAYATRERLARAGPERLRAKRLVIWQFAVRELTFGDWRLVELPD